MPQTGLTIGILIILLEVFLLTNPTVISVTEPEKVQNIMLIYLVMQASILAGLGLAAPSLSFTFQDITYLLLGSVITFFIVTAIPGSIVAGFEPLPVAARTASAAFAWLYIFVRVNIEEKLFRGILAPRLGGFLQAVIFGLFHFTVLSVGGASLEAVLFGAFFLSLLGYIWFLMAKHIGFQAAVGSHLIWNAHAFGVI